ncbi:hypothetical protein ACTU3I_05730 [Microbacterium sp. RD1]|uniref:hypothetical protein n=1 Tax=Microbacterium sp. RD1 TaxID=3457313 RepID=UPI003FA5FCBD
MSAVTPGAAAIDAPRPYTITVTARGDDGDVLMRLVSVFHRRQIEILHVTYSRVAEMRWMVASVQATQARLRTLALTLWNTVGVTGYEVSPDIDSSLGGGEPALDSSLDRGGEPVPAFPPRRPTKTSRQELV